MDIHLTIEFLGKGKNEYTLNDAKTEIKEWKGSDAKPTSDELTKGWNDYQAAQAAIKYKTDRKPQYPSLTDFADAMYWNSKGDDTNLKAYYAACEKVKTDNPKPS